MSAPRASYRIQLRGGMTLRRARRQLAYLRDLGVSHVYLSPVLQARTGSTHGYDVIDPRRIDPALGGERALRDLAREARRLDMRIIADVVPNHMAADAEGVPFDDVLRHGRDSPFAPWFDIDWGDAARPQRLLLPVLGAPLAEVLQRRELRLRRAARGWRVDYFERSFPVQLPDDARVPRAGTDPATLAPLLARQAYVLTHWRSALRRLNYRRFFDISDLIALRVEDPAVFEATHARLLELVEAGVVHGLRIDHVDGLLDPATYLQRLSASLESRVSKPRREPAPPVWVEKILAAGEHLPAVWRVAGTTGYDFLNEVEDVLIDPRGARELERIWRDFAGRRATWTLTARLAKQQALEQLFRPELDRLVALLEGCLPEGGRACGARLRTVLIAWIASLRVYRSYVGPRGGLSEHDARELMRALSEGMGELDAPLGLRRALRGLLHAPARRRPEVVTFLQRLQQLSGPAAAKGVEDTALYRHVALLSRCEVGADPGVPVTGALRRFHAANRLRARRAPRAMLAATTHDTKRSADVRARLDVLSEAPQLWSDALERWRRWNRSLRSRAGARLAPDANTEYLLYQTLIGIWPPRPPAAAELLELRARLLEHVRKATREAAVHTSWIDPDAAFETAVERFTGALLGAQGARFRQDLSELVARIAPAGWWNALARTLLQLTSPGFPDVYQGDELWSSSLVDPDNRRPVDFARRRRDLASLRDAFAGDAARREALLRGLMQRPDDGRIKLLVTWRALACRRRFPELFAGGSYAPLKVRGPRAQHVVAFLRRSPERAALVIAPRLPWRLTRGSAALPVGDLWACTHVALPAGFAGAVLQDWIGGRRLRLPASDRPRLDLSSALPLVPGALLTAPLRRS